MLKSKGYTGDGGLATSAKLNYPYGVAVDTAGNIYIADYGNNAIRMVSKSTGIITTVAGIAGLHGSSGDGGLATSATLGSLFDVAIDTEGNIYIADASNKVIRMVTSSTGIITTVAGIAGSFGFTGDGGLATSAQLGLPSGVAIDVLGNIYIAGYGNHVIRMVTKSTGIITTLASVGGYGIAVDMEGHIYISYPHYSIIQLIALTTPTSAPTSTPTSAPTYTPTSTPIFASTKTSAATSRTAPNLLAYLLISPFICFMGQLLFYSSW